jgi:hypothetical protein
MTKQQLYRVYLEARNELGRYAGVVGVGLGCKERKGAVTEEVAFRVYVRRKKPISELQHNDLVPSFYRGVATDVLNASSGIQTSSVCEDNSKYAALVGGITIMNGRRDGQNRLGVGTLGFLATIDGVEGPDNIALVSNRHVLGVNGAVAGDTVYQPDGNATLPNNSIGKILKLQEIDNYSYTYPGESAKDYWIDCSTAQINICISSCCHTNCGESFGNWIQGLNVNGSDVIADVGRAQVNDIVYKVGRTTRRTKGIVREIDHLLPGAMGIPDAKNLILIEPLEPDCNGILRFADEGDSGAAIITDQGKLVGILHTVAAQPQPGQTLKHLACHIAPVLDALKVTPITRAHPALNNPAAVTTMAEVAAVTDGRSTQARRLREQFLSLPEGPSAWRLIDEHRIEVIRLVNHNRRVAVAWHRNQGPAFLNRAINNARDPQETIPREIEGITGKALLGAMGDVLAEQGSAGLREAIQRYRHQVLALAEECDNLHEMVERLNERQPA